MPETAEKLMTASELATLCQVDLKTIHNWAEQGRMRHFRTPGRHLRFRPVDVVEFLRHFGYPVPEALERAYPRSRVLVVGNPELVARVQRHHKEDGGTTDVVCLEHPLDALVAAGAEPVAAFVFDGAVGTRVELAAVFEALHRARPNAELFVAGEVASALPPFVKRFADGTVACAA